MTLVGSGICFALASVDELAVDFGSVWCLGLGLGLVFGISVGPMEHITGYTSVVVKHSPRCLLVIFSCCSLHSY